MAARRAAALLLLAAGVARARRYNTSAGPVAGKINIHMVPHSHDDVGYVKTVEQYFWGTNFTLQNAGVQYVIDSVISALQRNPDRRFIYVEQAFFDMWWTHADPEDQALLSSLVQNGQLEFVNGGWSMHDEACPTYVDMIDNTALGVRVIKARFGVAPKVTWQIDPFGHSGVQSSLLTAAAGYVGLFNGRMDYQDYAHRQAARATEFWWQASPSQPSLRHYTDVFPIGNTYGPPDGSLVYDVRSGGFAPIVDDPASPEYNVKAVIDATVALAQAQANITRSAADGTVHILWTMGQDFQYIAAQSFFSNLDRLVHWLNADGRVAAFYSTPSVYAEAKLAQVAAGAIALPSTVGSDLMPYASAPHSMWSGYFSSRAALKGYVRDSSGLLQAARQVQAFSGGAPTGPDDPANPLLPLERAQAVLQHHDAVAGTERQHVAFDYARTLAAGRAAAEGGNARGFAALTGWGGSPFVTCDLANATICPPTEGGAAPTVVLLWNSLGQATTGVPVRLPVGLPGGVGGYAVTAPNGTAVPAQLLPASDADAALRTQYYLAEDVPMGWLAFLADLPPAGYDVYVLTPVDALPAAPLTAGVAPGWASGGAEGEGEEEAPGSARSLLRGGAAAAAASSSSATGPTPPPPLTNGLVTLTFGSDGALASWEAPSLGIPSPVPFGQEWAWYNSSVGDAASSQASGAYIFRPASSSTTPVSDGKPIATTITNGPVVSEARQTIHSWATQVIRLYAGRAEVEFEWTLGPVPTGDKRGKEVVARYTVAGMRTRGTWATDSNGRDMYTRTRDARPTWNYTVDEPVAGNYYPVNTRVTMADAASGLTLNVVTDRTQAGGSITDGSVELMVHRRTLAPINGLMHEALNEPGLSWNGTGLVVRGTHTVRLDASAASGAVAGRQMMQAALFPPRVAYAALPAGTDAAAWLAAHAAAFTGLSTPLPDNVHLLTVQSLGATSLLLRLAHTYAVDDPAPASHNVTVALAGLFKGFTITAAGETNLLGNMPLPEVLQRFRAVGRGEQAVAAFRGLSEPPAGEDLAVTLGPLEIRTFLCTTTNQADGLVRSGAVSGEL